MTPQMSFDVEPQRDLVRITLAGFFTPDDVARFVAGRDAAHRRLRHHALDLAQRVGELLRHQGDRHGVLRGESVAHIRPACS